MGGGYFTLSTYYVAGVPYSSELYHHGIKGQRWGIRRFQNYDGTLTAYGKERYGKHVENVPSNKLKRQLKRNTAFGTLQNTSKFDIEKITNKAASFDLMSKEREKFILKMQKEYASAVLKDAGYEATEKGVKYLLDQDWYADPIAIYAAFFPYGIEKGMSI